MIDADFSDIFAEYEALLAEVDAVFAKVKAVCPEQVRCEVACADCCHAPFDVTLVEALAINKRFNELHPKGDGRYRLTEAANRSDREHYRLKHKAWKAHKAGVPDEKIVEDFARERIRCALLGDDDKCSMYEARPVTCRLYGAPLNVNGQLRVCGKSGFAPGGKYPAVNIARLQQRLLDLSARAVERVGGKYDYLADMLVPVSMAMLSKYDEEFFGLKESKED
ncbi:YkgJ family cysteine cluster protein [Fundidesulfovibrio terrae]|uniref:YkgJ family cysteine cluster protein n=1 Tax=Fundidesulfovibrio terrae TaxID=2922866 RepID=UPI001FAE9F1C